MLEVLSVVAGGLGELLGMVAAHQPVKVDDPDRRPDRRCDEIAHHYAVRPGEQRAEESHLNRAKVSKM